MTHIRKPNRRPLRGLQEFTNGGICSVSGKVRYLDEATAERAKRWLAPQDPDRAQLATYVCPFCHDWHVGHDRSKADQRGNDGERRALHVREVASGMHECASDCPRGLPR